ncbi:MAG: hypothetical protein LC803_23990 [Acidobacteria bacterium]|nr:hypothetical protein [Acidobacteriota bacterium]
MARHRLTDDFYKDEEESKRRYYFPTLEGLEAILIPAIAISDVSWRTLFSDFPKIRNIVTEDIEYILELNANQKKQNQQGAPYFFTGRGASRRYYWISECGTFTLSTLINTLTLAKLFQDIAPSFNNELLREAIKHNVADLLGCAVPQGGWSWSKGGKTADAWATWSVIETFTDYLDYTDQYKIRFPESKNIKNTLSVTAEYLSAQLDWRSKDTITGIWHEKVYENRRIKTPNHVKHAYSFVHTMISSSLLKLQGHEQFRELAVLLFKSVENVKVQNVENLADVASKNQSINDYSYHPTLLRALTAIYVEMDEESRKDLTRRLNNPPIYYVKKQFDRLMKSYILKDKWAGLWGFSKSYEIYYTERTIEALVSLCEFLARWNKNEGLWKIPKPTLPSKSDLQTEFEKAMKSIKLK